jgi:fused signal recognition particle receptor
MQKRFIEWCDPKSGTCSVSSGKKPRPPPPDPDKTVAPNATTIAPDAAPDAVREGAAVFATRPRGGRRRRRGGARAPGYPQLRAGLRKTGANIAAVFTGTRIDESLYEELESALVLADTGVKATQHLLDDLKRRVKETKAHRPGRSRPADRCLTELLQAAGEALVVGEHRPP